MSRFNTQLGVISALLATLLLITSSTFAYAVNPNSNRALALAVSGCQRGGFDTYKYESTAYVIIYQSFMYRINTMANGDFEMTDIQLNSINHIEEAWYLAGNFNSIWKPLLASYENALAMAIDSWKQGDNFGAAINKGLVKNESRLNGLCKIANIDSNVLARKAKVSQKTWIVKNSGRYLPKIAKFIP